VLNEQLGSIATPYLSANGNFIFRYARENTTPLCRDVRRRWWRRKEVLKRGTCVEHGSVRTAQFNWYVRAASHFRP